MEVFDDLRWCAQIQAWTIGIRLTTAPRAPRNLSSTRWYVLLKEPYPWAEIHVVPAADGGITETYPHQRYNRLQENLPFLSGQICVQSGLQSIRHRSFDPEPLDPHERLCWYVTRASEWVEAASADELVLPGEPFEFPDFPDKDERGLCIAFNESAQTFTNWATVRHACGTLSLGGVAESKLYYVMAFNSTSGEPLVPMRWGTHVAATAPAPDGAWIRLPDVPTLDPWQAPRTWGELRSACRSLGVDVDGFLRRIVPALRDGARHVVLIGFPIPSRIKGPPVQLRWQGILLPVLAQKPMPGFRKGEDGLWAINRAQCASNTAIEWMRSENWSMNDLSSRGGYSASFRDQRILLLGVGALGSTVAELLVRGGVHAVTLIDNDSFEAGNLARHTLTLQDVGKAKAKAVADRLNLISPHAQARGFKERFPALSESASGDAQASTLVIDCTANDQVAQHALENFSWSGSPVFVSLSLGIDARRIYCFVVPGGKRFPSTAFAEATAPWLALERRENAGRELPREGVGCWNPAFPARFDDIWSLAVAALKHVEQTLAEPPQSPALVVFAADSEGFGRAVLPT